MDTIPDTAAFARIVQEIQAGDPAGTEELRARFIPGLQFLFTRGFGPGIAPELARGVLSDAASAILRGELSDPERLPALIRTLARRTAESVAGPAKREAAELNPASVEVAARVLKSLPPRAREALTRFYLQKQSPERVCSEMKLSPAQFGSLKSGAKREFDARLKRRPVRRPKDPAGWLPSRLPASSFGG